MFYPDAQARLQYALEHQAELALNYQRANVATGVPDRRRHIRASSLLARVLRRHHAPRPVIDAS